LKGEPLVEFETDKINTEFESPEEGFLLEILAGEEEEVAVSAPICVIGQPGENTDIDYEVVSSPLAVKNRILISPLARKIAVENGIDYSDIKGSRPNGRIVKKDIEKVVYEKNKPEVVKVMPACKSESNENTAAKGSHIPLLNMRKTIAQRLSQSKKEIPHAYFKTQVDMSKARSLKDEVENRIYEIKGIKPSFTHIIIKAAASAIERYPAFNASFGEDSIIRYEDINIGVAVELDDGLIVPVVMQAGKLTLGGICEKADELVSKARSGSLGIEDITGSTFTVSNLGMYGIDEFTAIINPPESAILAVGAIRDGTVVEKGEIKVKPLMNLVLSVDHRVIDGALAARFMKSLKEMLENPYLLLAL
ncbi:MAG: 2-oxo acid dehydrogenase subunit E2, partial [Ruminiclostridium sp.]|nr:2-oxo acid dehydrogenase subunit E2 [Ruminiclostridium sp.]